MKSLKRTFILSISAVMCALFLAGCGTEDPIEAKFKKDMSSFCSDISTINKNMNQITEVNSDEDMVAQLDTLYSNLNDLTDAFKVLSNINYPEKYEYLGTLAKEASDYMNEAATSYHKAYENGYNEEMEAYAKENYSRACKRMQFILSVVRGEDPAAN